MDRRRAIEEQIIAFLFLLLIHTNTIDAGASSTPKNLVNPHNTSTNDTSNQFQNEYRQTASKSTQTDRYKSSTPTITESAYEHTSGDLDNPSPIDYAFQDNHGTTNVPECKGRIWLNGTRGFITDGPSFYQTHLQCIWIINGGRDNATIRIQFRQFNTECNYDHVYIFDGDSVYSPLVAALSGDLKDFATSYASVRANRSILTSFNGTNDTTIEQTSFQKGHVVLPQTTADLWPFEIKTNSGKAFIYFHSDTAQTMPGFYMTYTVDSCPLDCSNRGECNYKTLECKCGLGYFGDGCQFNACHANCNSSETENCDKGKSCLCNSMEGDTECFSDLKPQDWLILDQPEEVVPARAFHQSIIADNQVWIIGGKSKTFSNTNNGIFRRKSTSTVFKFDIATRKMINVQIDGTTNIDHLAELSGHSVAVKGNKIFIYGGMSMNNTILNSLTVLDTKSLSITSIPTGKEESLIWWPEREFVAPIPVVGHTANIVGSHMYVFLGYNPIYGYLSYVQKFNLADNTWSFVEKKGSSIEGRIHHTTTYDPISGLIFLYGGHHSHRINSLYSFDTHTEVWTYLHRGPAARYYHSAVIIGRQLVILGGNSYNSSDQSDQCFQQTYLSYDLTCSQSQSNYADQASPSSNNITCGKKCWQTIYGSGASYLKRHGLSVVNTEKELILFGGFNGMLMNDIGILSIGYCSSFSTHAECVKPKLGLNCYWNEVDTKCEDQPSGSTNTTVAFRSDNSNCSRNEIKALQHTCEQRDTCTDCLSTSFGCVWCGFLGQCQYNKCKSMNSKAILDADLCFKDEIVRPSLMAMSMGHHQLKDLTTSQDFSGEIECKQYENCYLCLSIPHCSWHNDLCVFSAPNLLPSPALSLRSQEETAVLRVNRSHLLANRRLDELRSPYTSPFTIVTSPFFHNCGVPCYLRRSCNECASPKCIWCSTTEQCVDSTAYFAYHAMGQCMHYVAHSSKCPVASCAGIESCDKCLTNPKCGWLNDISNTGKGRCIEGTSEGPHFGSNQSDSSNSTSIISPSLFNSWYFTSCPACQCNGHSYCKPNTSTCVQPCQDNTEGTHCESCIPGFYGSPINGNSCQSCQCNGHAQSCNRESGKCYCTTKGIAGSNCNKCDEQYHFIGDISSAIGVNGTCYYNLTTDYQYTFNMSKPEDHFYSDINFINVPIKKDLDVDFTIACSRLALVNITAGSSYKNRRPTHTSLECGSFRLKFPLEKLFTGDANYSFFVHVYKFQTPFILQIAFSQQRTIYLPQFFFTFTSCFLFFFALSGLVWKLKHEYDLYARRQRQYIEMEQMASRPFSTILLEIFKSPFSSSGKSQPPKQPSEPTPISFEPCFGSNVGVLSFFVQLPGKPNLAIGSALVSLNEDPSALSNNADNLNSTKRSDKDHTSTKNDWC